MKYPNIEIAICKPEESYVVTVNINDYQKYTSHFSCKNNENNDQKWMDLLKSLLVRALGHEVNIIEIRNCSSYLNKDRDIVPQLIYEIIDMFKINNTEYTNKIMNELTDLALIQMKNPSYKKPCEYCNNSECKYKDKIWFCPDRV